MTILYHDSQDEQSTAAFTFLFFAQAGCGSHLQHQLSLGLATALLCPALAWHYVPLPRRIRTVYTSRKSQDKLAQSRRYSRSQRIQLSHLFLSTHLSCARLAVCEQ